MDERDLRLLRDSFRRLDEALQDAYCDPSVIRKYVLGTTGHDGVTAVVIKNVATRVVCANILGVALGERGGATWRIQHIPLLPGWLGCGLGAVDGT